MRSRSRNLRALALTAAAAGAAGIALQRRHAGAIARDADYMELSGQPEGRALSVSSSDGTRLHVESFGSEDGAPTVVFAHGWTERLTIWGPVIQILVQEGFRCVAYDLRGHGHSAEASEDDYALERFGDDVEAVLRAITAEDERAIVVGHSLGAMSIAAWAAGHEVSRHARAVALVNTGLGDLVTGHLLLGEAAARFNNRATARLVLGSRAPVPRFSSPVSHALIRHVAFGPQATAGQIAFYEQMLMACPPGVRAACGVAITDLDLHDAVERLTVPTLVVAGDRDRLTPPAHAERIAEALPHSAGLTILEETGHMSPLERPRELTDGLRALARMTADEPARA
jgi:pimeloyl-ACP methyl ester carboxylesterase